MDLHSLLLTAHGNQILTTLGIGITCGEENLDRIESAVSDLGFRLRTSDKTVDARTLNMCRPLAEYVWAIADYRAELRRRAAGWTTHHVILFSLIQDRLVA